MNEIGIKFTSMNNTIVSNLEAMNEMDKLFQLNIDQPNKEKIDDKVAYVWHMTF